MKESLLSLIILRVHNSVCISLYILLTVSEDISLANSSFNIFHVGNTDDEKYPSINVNPNREGLLIEFGDESIIF